MEERGIVQHQQMGVVRVAEGHRFRREVLFLLQGLNRKGVVLPLGKSNRHRD